jgi:phytoene desaturase
MKKRIAVIGGGFGGLAAANRLAAKGHEVHLFEKRDKLGGRGYQYEINGFKFDGGPTVITAPYIFDEVFEAAGKKRDDYFKLVPLDPFYRIFDHNGRQFDYRHQLDDMLAEIDKWNPAIKKATRSSSGKRKNYSKSSILTPISPFWIWQKC